MNELIKVDYSNDRPAVSARELHEFLEVETPFSKWFPRMCEYGFTEGESYRTFLSNRSDGLPGKPRQDAAITIDMAKEICMLQRNEKGKIARQYFLQLEKEWNSPEKVMARALLMADRKINEQNHQIQALTAQTEEMRPKALFADSVKAADTSILIGELAKILRQNGVDTGEKRLFVWMRDNGYLIKRKGTDYNMPTQKSMELKLFQIKETVINHSDGHTSVNRTVKVTGKGQVYFVNKFLGGKGTEG